MDLLRRTSGASSNGSDMSTKLPDSALAGLSNEERDHIEKVLSAANRRSRSSQSTPTASRKHSMYKLPDMNDFELCERTHIEGVIEKAEKGEFPFVIKVTNADTVKEDSVDVADVKKFDSTVTQTSNNTNESEELLDSKSTVILEIPLGNTCLSEKLDEQQIVGARGGTFNREDRPRSPISFLWRTSQRQSDASSRKSSPDGRNEFMDLLRRTSGASSNGSDMSTKLPD
ncbi:hypothetical protein WUBG_16477, partial [Wuchereria bancrofti]